MRMLIVFFLVCGVIVASQPLNVLEEDLKEWEDFKMGYMKNYSTKEEEEMRKLVFISNLQFIREHNQKYDKGEVTYTLGTNEYADLSTEEFNAMLNGFIPSPVVVGGKFEPGNLEIPSWVDWRLKGAVTGVKNQKDCGSCWAFSATGALEAANFFNTSKLVSLSEQNLIDCTVAWPYKNGACYGGYTDRTFQYVIDNNGIDTEKSYKYTDTTDYMCHYNSSHKGGTATGYTNIAWGDDAGLLAAVATVGPISVGVESSLKTFHLYRAGVYYDAACSYNNINHAVLAVGYGQTLFSKRRYWTLKNSWGWSWGEFGYMRLARNQSNMCGISSQARFPYV